MPQKSLVNHDKFGRNGGEDQRKRMPADASCRNIAARQAKSDSGLPARQDYDFCASEVIPSTPGELARAAIMACLDYNWKRNCKSVQVAVVSLRLASAIPEERWGETLREVLEKIRKILCIAAERKVEFVWYQKSDVTSRFKEPAFEAIFMGQARPTRIAGKKLQQRMQQYLGSACDAVKLQIPPGYLGPELMLVDSKFDNLDRAIRWFKSLTEPAVRFQIVAWGCSKPNPKPVSSGTPTLRDNAPSKKRSKSSRRRAA